MLHVILLAGGKSRRMLSDLPKVLHAIGGKPLLAHLIETVIKLQPKVLSIVYHSELIFQTLSAFSTVHWLFQKESLGTGHAVAEVLPYLSDDARVLILPGDTPLISLSTLEAFIREIPSESVGLMTQKVASPKGLGRIVRDSKNQVIEIIEDKDASVRQKKICEVNLGCYLVSARLLKRWVPRLSNQNAQKEYYLTNFIKMAQKERVSIAAFSPLCLEEMQGVNNRYELSLAQKTYQCMQTQHFLESGLGLKDPDSFWLYGHLQFGKDVTIYPHVTLEGRVILGDQVKIGPYSFLKDVTIEAGATIESACVIKNATIQKQAKVGPFAHIHNKVDLMEKSVVGNFVEVTRSQIGRFSKVKHLSYMGDVIMGERVNIGAGTISCNYDGIQKHRTYIEKNSHIGAHTAIVAPATIGVGATIGAGSVITRDAPSHQLTLSRTPQVTVASWQRPVPKKHAYE